MIPYSKHNLDSKIKFWELVELRHAAQKEILKKAKARLDDRFSEYTDKFSKNELGTIADSPNSFIKIKHELLTCYSSKSSSAIKLLAEIRKANAHLISACPYCGISIPRTIDHFFPKENYPEYSMFAVNLIPACSECNEYKKTKVVERSERLFIFPYLDRLPAPIIKPCISKSPNALGVSFVPNTSHLPSQMKSIVDSHLLKLHIIERYNEIASEELADILGSLRSQRIASKRVNYSQFLMRESERLRKKFGENYWRHLLRLEMSKITDIQQYIPLA